MKNNFYYNAIPLTPTEQEAVKLFDNAYPAEEVAAKLGITLTVVRALKGRVLFRRELNHLANEKIEAGIALHNGFLSAYADPSQVRASISALKEMKNYQSKPTTAQAIMEQDYIESLSSEQKKKLQLEGGLTNDIKDLIEKAIKNGGEFTGSYSDPS